MDVTAIPVSGFGLGILFAEPDASLDDIKSYLQRERIGVLGSSRQTPFRERTLKSLDSRIAAIEAGNAEIDTTLADQPWQSLC